MFPSFMVGSKKKQEVNVSSLGLLGFEADPLVFAAVMVVAVGSLLCS